MIGDKLKEIRESMGLNKKEFAELLDTKYTTYNNYETGTREPASDFLIMFSKKFDTSIDYLMGLTKEKEILHSYELKAYEMEYIEKYRTLDQYGKRAVDSILDIEIERIVAAKEQAATLETPPAKIVRFASYYQKFASAGLGEYMFDDMVETQIPILDTEESRLADFVVGVNGDSMEPHYYDGDIVLVKAQEIINIGDIGIFILNNESFIKKTGENKLISLNPEYDDIIVKDSDDFHCVGKVIGKAELA